MPVFKVPLSDQQKNAPSDSLCGGAHNANNYWNQDVKCFEEKQREISAEDRI